VGVFKKNIFTYTLWILGSSFFLSFLFIHTAPLDTKTIDTATGEKQVFKEGIIKTFKNGSQQWILRAATIEVGKIVEPRSEDVSIPEANINEADQESIVAETIPQEDLYEKNELYTPETVQNMVTKTKKYIYGDNAAQTEIVEIKMYDVNGVHTNTITGKTGIINFDTGDFWLTEDVVIINEEKKLVIKTEELFYSSTHRRFFSTQNVVITDEHKATLHGSMMDTDTIMNEMYLFNTNGIDITKSFLSGLRLNRTRFDLK